MSSNAVISHETNTTTPSTRQVANDTRKSSRRPWGLRWRSSIWFITLAVGIGIGVDIFIYSMIVPIIPFQLQAMGYDGVGGLVGWLLFAYSAALVISTPPIAHLSEIYKNRKIPLLCGQIALIGSQVMLMEAPAFWVMVLARVAQGISATVIWVIGLALVGDTVPEAIIGKQMGLVMMGMSIGFLVGPPIAGALDQRFGFRAPFILGVIVTVFELMCRLLIVERHEAARWDGSLQALVNVENKTASRDHAYGATVSEKRTEQPTETVVQSTHDDPPSSVPTATDGAQPPVRLSILGLLLKLIKSSRAMTPVLMTLIYGIMMTNTEPALPLYLQTTYALNVSKIGLVYLAAVVPTFLSSPLSGWYSDRGGTITSTLACLIGMIPFWILIFINGPLAYFIVMFGCLNFFVTGVIAPITAELALVARDMEGVGYGHVYGAFNVAYGIGSAIGPVIGGQLYDHVTRGWMALSLFNLGLVAVGLIVTLCFFGERPVLKRMLLWLRGNVHEAEQSAVAA